SDAPPGTPRAARSAVGASGGVSKMNRHQQSSWNDRRPVVPKRRWAEGALLWKCLSAISAVSAVIAVAGAQTTPRASDQGLPPSMYPPGALNAITDVEGVHVGHTTVVEGERVRTGVTAILPHTGNLFQDKVAGAVFVGNAFGKLAGSTQ